MGRGSRFDFLIKGLHMLAPFTERGQTMQSLRNFFGRLRTHCDVLTVITIFGVALILIIGIGGTQLAIGETVRINTHKDCTCDNLSPDENNNDENLLTIFCERRDSGDMFYVGLVQFDISAIPSSATINWARLYLYCYAEENRPQVTVNELAGPWSESRVTME